MAGWAYVLAQAGYPRPWRKRGRRFGLHQNRSVTEVHLDQFSTKTVRPKNSFFIREVVINRIALAGVDCEVAKARAFYLRQESSNGFSKTSVDGSGRA